MTALTEYLIKDDLFGAVMFIQYFKEKQGSKGADVVCSKKLHLSYFFSAAIHNMKAHYKMFIL